MKTDIGTFWASTSTGTIAFFEPGQVSFEEYFNEELYTCINHFKDGHLILFGIGGDGSIGMSLCVSDEPITKTEQSMSGRLKVTSGKLFFGPGESLPYDDNPFEETEHVGEWANVPPGNYQYVILVNEPTEEEEDDDDGDAVPYLECILVPVNSLEDVDYPKYDIPDVEA